MNRVLKWTVPKRNLALSTCRCSSNELANQAASYRDPIKSQHSRNHRELRELLQREKNQPIKGTFVDWSPELKKGTILSETGHQINVSIDSQPLTRAIPVLGQKVEFLVKNLKNGPNAIKVKGNQHFVKLIRRKVLMIIFRAKLFSKSFTVKTT